MDKLWKELRRDRGKSAAIIDVPTKSSIHQADLLRLPEDNSFKYALVVVDAGNRACDNSKYLLNIFSTSKYLLNIVKSPKQMFSRIYFGLFGKRKIQ